MTQTGRRGLDWTGLGAMEVGALHSQSKQSERMKKDEKKAVVVVMTVMTGHKDRCVVNKCAMWSVERIYSHFTKTRSEVPVLAAACIHIRRGRSLRTA